MTRVKFLKFWSLGVGLMDAMTGLLLIFSPALVLRVLGLEVPGTDSLVFLSWIGVFVMSVGLSYGLVLGGRGRGEAVWIFTAGVRAMVALFLVVQVLSGRMSAAWLLVGFSDASVAAVQWAIFWIGWWKEVDE